MMHPAMDPKGFIDLHAHVLHGVDDGPGTLEEVLAVIAGMSEMGYVEICATPHQRSDLYAPHPDQIQVAAAELRAGLNEHGSAMKVRIGAENCWDDLFFERVQQGSIPTYEGTKSFLLEMPGWFLPAELDRRLFDLRRSGYLPVIAHIERYQGTPDLLERARSIAEFAVITCNLESLGGSAGRRAAGIARKAVTEGIAQVLCSDIHGEIWLKDLAKGFRWLSRRVSADRIDLLLKTNPMRVLAGEMPE